tara:strand:- start:124 stop:306 length:183 start_codon:yes stop_codon:yes gene_type:complete
MAEWNMEDFDYFETTLDEYERLIRAERLTTYERKRLDIIHGALSQAIDPSVFRYETEGVT